MKMRGRLDEKLGIGSILNFGKGEEVRVSWILGFKKEKSKWRFFLLWVSMFNEEQNEKKINIFFYMWEV